MRHERLIPLLLVLVTVASFSEVRNQGFVSWDDDVNIYRNEHLRPPTLENLGRFWQREYFGMYIPVTYMVWGAAAAVAAHFPPDAATQGPNPQVFHIVNLLAHLLNVLLVYLILRRLVRREWAAAAGALLFGLHPIQVESVAWITGMKDLLGGCFSLLAFWQYLAFVMPPDTDKEPAGAAEESAPISTARPHPSRSGRRPDRSGPTDPSAGARPAAAATRNAQHATPAAPNVSRFTFHVSRFTFHVSRPWVHYALATAFYCLAILSKPSSVAVPLIAWAVGCWMLGRPTRRVAPALLPWVALVVPAMLITRWAQDPGASVGFVTPVWARPFVAGDALAFYLGKLVLPLNLVPDYGRSAASVLQSGVAYATWVVPAVVAFLIWRGRARRPWLVAAGVVFVAGVLPVLGFTRFVFQEVSTVTDRYAYLAMLGPALGLAALLARRPDRRLGIACAVWLSVLGMLAMIQTTHWYGTVSLFEHTLTVNPRSSVAHNNLGAAFYLQGRFAEAAEHYSASLKVAPDDAQVHDNLAAALDGLGRPAEADEHWYQAIRLDPADVLHRMHLGIAMARRGRLDDAMEQWSLALETQPDFQPARSALERARQLKAGGGPSGASKR